VPMVGTAATSGVGWETPGEVWAFTVPAGAVVPGC